MPRTQPARKLPKNVSKGKSAMATRSPKAPKPELPHEHDESVSGQRGGSRNVIRRAANDLKAGRIDTDRGVEMDAAYKKQKKP